MSINRRKFLVQISAATAMANLAPSSVLARPVFSSFPFKLGVASGDPTSDSIVLWTKLAPEPLEPDGGVGTRAIWVDWVLAKDENFKKPVRRGRSLGQPQFGHSVHVDVRGLEPARHYWYQFFVNGIPSPIGRTRTLPAVTDRTEHLRFSTCSCQHYEDGYFSAYLHMILDEPDFVLHIGDYIYDVSFNRGVRKHESDETPTTLAEYRLRHAVYRLDLDLQAAHQQLPFVLVPDNHDALPDNDRTSLRRRAAAYQAWFEFLPIRSWYREGSAALAIYRRMLIGQLCQLEILDTRQFRHSVNVGNSDPDFAFGVYRADSIERQQLNRSMLGYEQNHWLQHGLADSHARWNGVVSSVPYGRFDIRRPGETEMYYYGGSWDGYPANRTLVDQSLAQCHRPVLLSADIHSFWAKNVDIGPDNAPVPEFVASSISSGFPSQLADPLSASLEFNPSVALYEPRYRGYCLHDVYVDRWETRMRAVDSVRGPTSKIRDLAGYRVDAKTKELSSI